MPPIQQLYIPQNIAELTSPTQAHRSSFRVLRTSDNRQFLASKIPATLCKDIKSTTVKTKVADAVLPTAAKPLSHLLNHPNIISIIDIVRNEQLEYGSGSNQNAKECVVKGMIVWEDMECGSLAYVLPAANSYPAWTDTLAWHQLASQDLHRQSLPEGLCWHVLRSVGRALLWLHHGIKETPGIVRGEMLPNDEDWHAVMIMDISPSQIWFKAPKREETYGECKLGGFGRARVAASVGAKCVSVSRDDEMHASKKLWWAPEVYRNIFSPTRASEIYSLGAVLYTMMTSIPPPRIFDYDVIVSRLSDKGFSEPLKNIVKKMLMNDPGKRPTALELVVMADDGFEAWRSKTVEGARYVDKDDAWREKMRGGPGKGLF